MNDLRLSIITPSYNQGRYIEDTILSVIQQDYPNRELIIIDGGSQDETVEVIRKYEKNLAYWVSEPDSGQSHAINKGLRVVTGDIVTWVNSDDLLTEGALNRVADTFSVLPDDIGLIHGGTIRFDNRGVIDQDFGYSDPAPERYLSGMAFAQPSSFFKRKLLERIGSVDESLHYGMDYDLFARLALVTKFRRVDSVFSKYRIHSSGKTVAGDDRFIEDWAKTFVKVARSLRADWILSELGSLKIFDRQLDEVSEGFNFKFEIPVVDVRLMFFYFLSYVFKSDYRNSNFARARVVSRYLIEQHSDLVVGDQGIRRTMQRLEIFPGSFIKLMRRVKGMAV